KKPEFGIDFPWKFMTQVTYGNRLGEVYILAGPEGIGKTEFMYELLNSHINQGYIAGLLDFERQPEQTTLRLIAKRLNKRVYLPDCPNYNQAEVERELKIIENKVALY